MKVKIATWNMGYWQHTEKTKQAWDFLDKTISPDIALVQEAVPISNRMGLIGTGRQFSGSLIDNETIIWQEIGGKRKWGSGILTKTFPLREVHFKNSHPGSVIVAEVLLPNNSVWTCISLYGLLDHGYSITTLHRIFSDLTLILDGKMGKRLIVLGGDFNASLQWDKKQRGESHRIMFERLENFGLINCLNIFHPEPVQTWRSNRGDTPWQLDYLFASKELRDSLISCDVENKPEVHGFSDHNPVVAIFDIV